MAVIRPVAGVCAGLLGVLAPAAPPAAAARRSVTDIREVVNQTSGQAEIANLDDKLMFTVAANGQWTGSTWIGWASDNAEAWRKNIIVRCPHRHYYLFQDYNDSNDTVKYSQTRHYADAVPLPGGSGAGRKRLVIHSDSTLTMESVT